MISDANKIHVVSFSGGRTSARLVNIMKQKQEREGWDVHYVYMDTGAEHPKTYDFIRNVARKWDIPLTCIRTKYNDVLGQGNDYEIVNLDSLGPNLEPWVGMLKKYGAPSVMSPYCTSRMKTEPHDKFLNDRFGRGNYETWLGIRVDEPRRLTAKPGVRYLAEISTEDKADILHWWRRQEFDLDLDEHLGNCVFCIKKGLNKIALAAKDEPKLALDFIKIVENNESVRVSGRKHNHTKMYRCTKHLSTVISDYSDVSRDYLFQNLRSSKRFEANSCSESCEVFSTTDTEVKPS